MQGVNLGHVIRKLLLSLGILSSLWYIVINIVTPAFFPGYDIASQTISELSAIDAPSRVIWERLAAFYSVFVILFGIGVWQSPAANKPLKLVSVLLILFGISGFFWPPMHLREVLAAGGKSITDTLHIAMTFVTVILMTALMIAGALALGRGFRFFSLGCLVLLYLFGILTALESPGIEKNLPTPYIGIWERINIGIFLVWVIYLAIVLIRRGEKPSTQQTRMRPMSMTT